MGISCRIVCTDLTNVYCMLLSLLVDEYKELILRYIRYIKAHIKILNNNDLYDENADLGHLRPFLACYDPHVSVQSSQ